MRSAPLWFGDPERRLFGWLDTPDDGRVRAGVVLCPPLAVEQASTKPALVQLSRKLADEGYAVLRFDYDGTGDSAGLEEDGGRLDAWLGSVRAALDAIARLGCTRTVVVGLRMGALLAMTELRRRGGADAVVLWDPCVSGRSFMRQQSALRRMIGRGAILEDGSVECLGTVLFPDTVAELRPLDLSEQSSDSGRMLVMTRSGRSVPDQVREGLDGPGVEWVAVDGQEQLVDVEPARVIVPEASLDRIVEWVVDAVGGESGPITVPDPVSAVVGRTPDGRAIREQVVWLGPDGLFGIETAPDAPRPPDTPHVVFLNAGVIDHVGPGRAWVVLARRLANHGLRSVRFDLSGIGATPARTTSGERATQSIDMLQDIAHAQAAISPDDAADVVLVGLCSGGYHAAEAALSTGARGVVMINPSFRLAGSDHRSSATAGVTGEERQVVEAPKRWVGWIPTRTFLWKLSRRCPDGIWRIVNRVAIDHPPAETMTRLVRAGTDVLLASDDYDAWFLFRGGRRALRGYERDGRVRVVAVTGMDHTLFCRQPRVLTCDLVVDHLVGRYVRTTEPTVDAAGPDSSDAYLGGTSEKGHDLVDQ